MARMTLRRLQVFVGVVEAGGFRACSDQLFISPAAVSHQIKQLESEFGYSLFQRARGRLCGLTEQGARAYAEAKELLDHADHFGSVLTPAPKPQLRHISVLADAILEMHLAKQIAAFVSEQPLVDVCLKRSHFEEMVDALGAGRADIAYFYSAGPVNILPSEWVWLEPLSICAGSDHPVLQRQPLTLRELREFQFVAPPAGTHFRRSVDSILRHQGLDKYPTALETGHANIAREAVIGGFAISAVITRYLHSDLLDEGVREVELLESPMAMEVRRAVRRDLTLDRTVQALNQRLSAAAPETSRRSSSSTARAAV